ALHDADQNAATSVAQWANARLPRRDSGNQLLFGNEAGQVKFGIAATRKRRARAGGGAEFYELSTIHSFICLIMTIHAVVGDLPVLVTFHAEPHGVVHHPFGRRHMRNVPVTGRTFDVVSNVRCVIEPNMGHRRKAVDPLPGYFFAASLVSNDLLDLLLSV